MAGLVPAIHVLLSIDTEGVDARHKAGHDEEGMSYRRNNLSAFFPAMRRA
jgi:hypothetical protein